MLKYSRPILILFAVGVHKLRRKKEEKEGRGGFWNRNANLFVTSGQVISGLFAVFLLLSTSYVIIEPDKIGLLHRIYLADDMDPGQIIAFSEQKGPQAKIFPPGFHFSFLLNVLYEVKEEPLLEVPEGKYGYIVAKDGLPLKKGQYLADAWPDENFKNMLDAKYFLKNGGCKGPQLTVLPPGKYRLNKFLFQVQYHDATDIPAGFVGVIKSNVQEAAQWKAAEVPSHLLGSLAVPLVKKRDRLKKCV